MTLSYQLHPWWKYNTSLPREALEKVFLPLPHHAIPVITQHGHNRGLQGTIDPGTILLFCPNHAASQARPPAPLLCPSIHIYHRFHSTPLVLWLIYTVPNWPFQMCPTAQGEWGKFTARNQKYATLWNMGFFMAWFELRIRNCGAVQWLFTIWGREKAVQMPSGPIFHSPIRRSHRWLKAPQAAATAGPAGHILEKEMYFSKREEAWEPTSTEKVGTNSPGECRGGKKLSNFPFPFSSSVHPWISTNAPLIRAFLSSVRAWMVFGLTYHEAAILWGDAEVRIISTKTRASLRALGDKSTRNWGKQQGRVQDLGVSCDQPWARTCKGRSHYWQLERTVVWTGESGKSCSLQRRHAAKEEARRRNILLSLPFSILLDCLPLAQWNHSSSS